MKLFNKTTRTITAITALATLASAAAVETASAAILRCPLSLARRTITTPLPGGWWTTPIINRLSATRLVTFGDGSKALQCVYGASGSVQRKPPAGQSCRAVRGGFRCNIMLHPRPITPRPQTFSTGRINLRQTSLADFDRNSSARRAADIRFQAETRDLLYLVPWNGAKIGVGNRSNRGFAGCSTARMSTHRVSLRDVPVGSYVCIRTNEGQISQFRMNAISRGSPKTLSLGYTTWR